MRLITFGCSLTFGTGLPDLWTKKKFKRVINNQLVRASKYAWPAQLGKILGAVEVLNFSWPGASNKEITHQVHTFLENYKIHSDDIIIVNWSHTDRSCLFEIQDDKSIFLNRWVPSSKEKKAMMFFRHLHNEYDMLYDLHTRINYVNLLFNRLGVKNFHAYSNDKHRSTYKFSWFKVPMLLSCMGIVRKLYPLGLDDSHPGEEAHNVYARVLYNEIKNPSD